MATADDRYLLDTHTFLWMTVEPSRLGKTALERVERPQSKLLLSLASVWEMAIKASLGKLVLPGSVAAFVDEQLAATRTRLLAIELPHALRVAELTWHHRDPFDRLLVSQSLEEGLPLLSGDAALDQYGVQRIW